MADSLPDISGIIKLIMENPKLIEEVKKTVSGEKTDTAVPPSSTDAYSPPEKDAVQTDSAPVMPSDDKSRSRRELLYALKPYLSEKRSRAIDSMLSVAEVLTVLRR